MKFDFEKEKQKLVKKLERAFQRNNLKKKIKIEEKLNCLFAKQAKILGFERHTYKISYIYNKNGVGERVEVGDITEVKLIPWEMVKEIYHAKEMEEKDSKAISHEQSNEDQFVHQTEERTKV